MKKIFLLTVLCMVLFTSCSADIPQNIEEGEGKVLTFAFFSDLHNNKVYYDRVMGNIAALTEESGLDGLVLIGDIVYNQDTDIPSKETYAMINENELFARMKAEGKLVFAMGNHEFTLGATDKERCDIAKKVFFEETGLTPEKDTVLGGYHFITVGPDTYTGELSSEQEKYAMDTVRAALSDGSDKPVFLLIHHPVDNTLYGSVNRTYVSDEFEEFVKSEPRLIVVSGHTHYPSSDPQSIYQVEGGSTFFYTSSIMGGNGASVPYSTERHSEYPSQGIIVQINDKTNVVTLKRFYTDDSEPTYLEGGEWTLDIPAMVKGKKGAYKYTEARAENSAKPYFAEGSEIKLDTVTDIDATFTFPAALQGAIGEDSAVAYYKIDLYNTETGEILKTSKIISDYFLKNKRESYTYTVFDLPHSTDFKVTVTPVTPWYVEGDEPLSLEFTTAAPKFAEVALDEDTKITQGIYDAKLMGTYTSWTGLIHIGSGSSCTMRHVVEIEKSGIYRVFITGSAAGAVPLDVSISRADEIEKKEKADGTVEYTVKKDTKIIDDEVVINSGNIHVFKDIICADFEAETAGSYVIKFKKKKSDHTIGLKGITVTKHN